MIIQLRGDIYGCAGCPFAVYYRDEPAECYADERVDVVAMGPAPLNCPLRVGPVTVQLFPDGHPVYNEK
ncbi:MAG: hypothetical protein E6R03_09635 [Hyphomicrobiaceae bacterium]|nr:MAG: hypothetical protein E6R03_09635 [Hyphomicrobiaceae bacterium]